MTPQARTVATVLLALVLLASPAAALSGGVDVSGTVVVDADDGPAVEVATNDKEMIFDGPDGPNTVNITHTNGTAVFNSSAPTNVSVDSAQLEGTFSRVTAVDTPTSELTVDPGDKDSITVADLDSIEFRTATVGDGARDFSYSAPTTATVEIATDAPNTKLAAVDSTDAIIDTATADSAGRVRFDGLDAGSYDITVQAGERPELSNPSPSDSAVSNDSVELSIDVSDRDFDGRDETVDVSFYDASDDSLIGNDTLTANGTASVTDPGVESGKNSWYAVAEDSFEFSVTSTTATYQTPDLLYIRDITDQSLLDNTNNTVEVELIGSDDTVEIRSTSDGVVDMAGLPVDERFVASVDAEADYVQRNVIISSILEQQTVYMLPTDGSVSTVEPRMTLSDPTNTFDEEQSEVTIYRPITINGSTQYKAVAGDRVGINGFDTILESGQRYRVEVRAPDGRTKRVGEFTPTVSEEIRLTIDKIEYGTGGDFETADWRANYVENEESTDQIEFAYEDPKVDSIDVQIYERGNKSNEILNETYEGNISVTEPVPDGGNTTVWTVAWQSTREDGETLSGSRTVSSSELTSNTEMIDDQWQSIFSMLGLVVIGGLFSRANASVGAIVLALVGGVFWMIGWLPTLATGFTVVLALFVAILSYIAQERQGVGI